MLSSTTSLNTTTRIKIFFKLKSFHFFNFKTICPKILNYTTRFNIKNVGFVVLPQKTKRFTILRSPHVDKKSREQFEMKIYTILLQTEFDLNNVFDKQKAKLLINFIQNSAGGLFLRITYKIV